MVDASTSKAESELDASSDDEDSQPEDVVNSNGKEVIFECLEIFLLLPRSRIVFWAIFLEILMQNMSSLGIKT